LVRFVLLPGIACLAAACGPAGTGDRVTRRDSAGVTIVENTGALPPDGAWAVAPDPLLSIGAAEGDHAYQFFGVAGLHRFGDGRIGVVDAGSREVRIFDGGGAFLRSFGRQGGGPEEFEMPILAGARGDTLLIIDRANHRLSWLHPETGFARSARVSDEVGGYLNPAGVFASGQVVFGGAFDMRKAGELQTGMNRGGTFYRSCNPNGSLATDFGDVPGAEFFIEDATAQGPASRPVLVPFGKVAQATASADAFYYSDQDGFEIRAYEPSGTLARLIRLPHPPVAVTEQDRQRYIDDVIRRVGDESQAAGLRRQLGSTPLPESFPGHGALMADRLAHLWVAEFDRPGAETRAWLVFDPAGALVARLTLPPDFDPLEIGADYILGVARDELGVEYVRMHRLDRESRAGARIARAFPP
jgi:hypothetical protein